MGISIDAARASPHLQKLEHSTETLTSLFHQKRAAYIIADCRV
jgi:hypothetical protein